MPRSIPEGAHDMARGIITSDGGRPSTVSARRSKCRLRTSNRSGRLIAFERTEYREARDEFHLGTAAQNSQDDEADPDA